MADKFDEGWMSDAELEAAKRRQPDPNRGQILPLYKGKTGVELAWPQFMVDMYNSVTLPRDTLQGYKPTLGDATNFASGVASGGVGGSAIFPAEADVGMFLGRKAKGADLIRLAKAHQMEHDGAPREDIWKETGWWQKPDGEWSWEMDDSNWNFSEESIDNLKNTGTDYLLTNKDFHPAIGQYDKYEPYNQPALSDGQIPVDFDESGKLKLGSINLELEGRYGGSYDAHNSTIYAKAKTEEDLKKVTLHEVQHAIQEAENWGGKGSNPEWTSYMRNKLESAAPVEWSDYQMIDKEVEKNIERRHRAREAIKDLEKEDSESTGAFDDFFKEQSDRKKDFYRNLIEESNKEYDQLMDTARKIRQTDNYKQFQAVVDDFDEIFGYDAFNMYERNEGEMISNLTMARSNLSESDRIAIPPWEDFGTSFSSDSIKKTLPEENRAWTDQDYNEFLQKWLQNPKGNLEDFNSDLKKAMSGKNPPNPREVQVSVEEFKNLLQGKKIRPASLNDVEGTHHKRKLYKHPNTGQWFVQIKED